MTFPLSPKLMLFLSWNQGVADHAELGRDHVHELNAARAAHSDRYLFAHICDQRIVRLAASFKSVRPTMKTQGFGPKTFSPVKVPRRYR